MLSNSLETGLNKLPSDSTEGFNSELSSVEELVNENKEFDLTKSEDLRLFLQSADNIYKEVIEFTKSEKAGEFKGRDGREVFNILNKKMARLRELVFECDENLLLDVDFVTDDFVNKMQGLYDDVVNLHDAIYEAYLFSTSSKKEVEKKNGTLKIKLVDKAPESNIKINVVRLVEEQAGKKIASNQVESLVEEIDSEINIEEIKFTPSLYAQKQPVDIHPIAETEREDPINVIYNEGVTEVVKINKEYSEQSLSNKHLSADKYINFIDEFYSSPEAFEKVLGLIISEIESQTDSKLDNWLGAKFNSPFKFIQDMSVLEVQELADDGEARSILEREGIKYETFLIWVDLIPDMQGFVEENESLLFGELFAKWIIESKRQEQQEIA